MRTKAGPEPDRRESDTAHFIDPARGYCQICRLSCEVIERLAISECPGPLHPVRRARIEFVWGNG